MAAIPDWQAPLQQPGSQKVAPAENVVLPLDGSSAARSALPIARRLAQLYNATLHIVYVGEQLLGPRRTLRQLGIAPEQFHGAVLDELCGDPGEAILRMISRLHAPLLVMCTHTGNRERDSNALVGSVADALLSSNISRIMLVAPERGEAEWQVNRVLLAHSGTPSNDVAARQAADIAHRAGADVLAMHVAARTAPGALEPGSIPAPRYVDQPQHEWPAWANEFLDRMMALGAQPAKVRFKLMVTGGQPGSEVAEFARQNQFDLVVAAWRGTWKAERIGPLKVIIRRSGCPVLLVYAPEIAAKPDNRRHAGPLF
ncbi:MAG: universal stress protein [Terriglobales bacterium]